MNNTFAMSRKPKAPEEFIGVDYVINDAVALRMYKALSVIALDPKIYNFLAFNDSKALKQVVDAIEEYKDSYQESNIDQ